MKDCSKPLETFVQVFERGPADVTMLVALWKLIDEFGSVRGASSVIAGVVPV